MSQIFNTNNPGIGDVGGLTAEEALLLANLAGLTYAEGDILYVNSSGDFVNLGIGADGYVLKVVSGLPSWQAAAGGGNVSNTGTPLNNQIAIWTDATTIEGDAALTFDTTTNTLATENLSIGVITFDTTPTEPVYAEGNVYWDATDKTLIIEQGVDDVKLLVGQELYLRVRNSTGSTITKGSVVYISGVTGNRPNISLAQADAAVTSEEVGVATHNIENNSEGLVVVAGVVSGIDTSGFSVDDTLYLSASVAGGLTNTAPTSPNFVIQIGKVLTSNPATGEILVSLLPFKAGVTSIDTLRVHQDANILGDAVVGDGSSNGVIKSNGNFDLVLQTGNASTGNITIVDGANQSIYISPDGGAALVVESSAIQLLNGSQAVNLFAAADSAEVYIYDASSNSSIDLFAQDGSTLLILEDTSAGALGPTITLYHNSASPAAADVVGVINFQGEDSAGNSTIYGKISSAIIDTTDTSEDGKISFNTIAAGTAAERVEILGTASAGIVQSAGNTDLILRTGNATTASITIADGANADITIAVDGAGDIVLDGDAFVNGSFGPGTILGSSTASANTSTAGGQYLSSSNTFYTWRTGAITATPTAGYNATTVNLIGHGITEAASGTHALIANLAIGQQTITNGAGATTNAATVYIQGAAIGTASPVNNYALWVDAGTSAFGGNVVPDTNDVAALGTTALQWSDIFLAEGAVINFDNGDLTLTQTGNRLTVAGGNLDLETGGNILVNNANPKRTLVLSGAGGIPTTTIGCGGPTKVEAGTNDIDYMVLEFDTTTEERAFWNVVMPDSYDGGTVTAQFIWTNAAGASTQTVDWGIKARAFGDDDAIDQAYGTEVTTTDTWLAQGDVHISAVSSAITIGGTPAGGKMVVFNVGRKVATDNMAGDARLIAVKIEYGISTYSD